MLNQYMLALSYQVALGPVSQEILSLGNIVAVTIFPKEIVSL